MMRGRFVEEQIIGIWKEQEARQKTTNVGRRLRISTPSFHRWRGEYRKLEASQVWRLKSLEDENARLKKMLSEATLARQS